MAYYQQSPQVKSGNQTFAPDTQALLKDLLSKNEKIKSLISDSLINEETDPSQPRLGRADDEMREIESIDFQEIERMIKKSLRDSEEQEKVFALKKVKDQQNFEEGEAILTTEYFNLDRADSDYFKIPLPTKYAAQQAEDLITTQEMSHLLEHGTIIKKPQANPAARAPKSPVFKNNMQLPQKAQVRVEGGVRNPAAGIPSHFMFDLKSVVENKSGLEESKSQQDGRNNSSNQDSISDQQLFGKRNKLNFETALIENSSVISNELDIKSPNEEDLEGVDCVSQQINSLGAVRGDIGLKPAQMMIASPISEKVRTFEDFILHSNKEQGFSLEEVVRQVTNKYKEELSQKLKTSAQTGKIINNVFELMTIDLIAELTINSNPDKLVGDKLGSLKSIDLEPHHIQPVYQTKAGAALGTNDDKSDNSSKYVPSVAAFSAQPLYQQQCSYCKRRVSANNITLASQKLHSGMPRVNPFSKKLSQMNQQQNTVKRVLSGNDSLFLMFNQVQTNNSNTNLLSLQQSKQKSQQYPNFLPPQASLGMKPQTMAPIFGDLSAALKPQQLYQKLAAAGDLTFINENSASGGNPSSNQQSQTMRKRSFSFDREQHMSRRESLVGQDPNGAGAGVTAENVEVDLLMKTAICRRDSLSDSHEKQIQQTVVRKGSIGNSGCLKESVYDTAVNNISISQQQQSNPPSI